MYETNRYQPLSSGLLVRDRSPVVYLSYSSSCIYLAWCVGVSKVDEIVVSSVGGAILTKVLEYDRCVANEYD